MKSKTEIIEVKIFCQLYSHDIKGGWIIIFVLFREATPQQLSLLHVHVYISHCDTFHFVYGNVFLSFDLGQYEVYREDEAEISFQWPVH